MKINDFRVQVLMGDFNMSLFRVVPELRERGVMIDLGAWYPWKSLEGEPMSDSCGIFFVNLPGVYTLTKSLRDMHDDNATGILARGDKVGDSAVAEKVKDGGDPTTSETGEDFGDNEDEPPDRVGGFDSIEENAGPGMRLETYLPKGNNWTEKFGASFTQSHSLAPVVATHCDRRPSGIKFKEKRLDIRIWRCKGDHQKGSHFPICVFTNNVGRRSPQKLDERRRRQIQIPRFFPRWFQGS